MRRLRPSRVHRRQRGVLERGVLGGRRTRCTCCPCGGEEFEAAVAFSLGDDGSVRWVTLGLRCVGDGFSAVYADWKIDYSPADHLLTMV